MLTPGHMYQVRSGAVDALVCFKNALPVRTLLPVGSEFVFTHMVTDPMTDLVHPHEAKKYAIYGGTCFDSNLDVVEVYIALAVMKVYPDSEKKPDEWYDNAPLMMFNKVTKGPVRVLFLDIDGVCNSDEFVDQVKASGALTGLTFGSKPYAKLLVDSRLTAKVWSIITAVTDLRVVLCSNWRTRFEKKDIEHLINIPLFDMTPKHVPEQKFSQHVPKGAFIEAWLNERASWDAPIEYVILDDDFDAADGFENVHDKTDRRGVMKHRHVQTNPATGISDLDVDRVLRLFS